MSSLSTQMKLRDREMVPRFLVQAMFTLMAAALLLVAYARLTDRPLVGTLPESPVVSEMSLTMGGTREGAVTVRNAVGTVIARSDEGPNGFIGVIWRVIDRQRITNDLAAGGPVTLARHENGLMTISDPATGWSIELLGYGSDNHAAFARLLDKE